jgi:hypothetical protein
MSDLQRIAREAAEKLKHGPALPHEVKIIESALQAALAAQAQEHQAELDDVKGPQFTRRIENVTAAFTARARDAEAALQRLTEERDLELQEMERAGWPCRLVEAPALIRSLEAQIQRLTPHLQHAAACRKWSKHLNDRGNDPAWFAIDNKIDCTCGLDTLREGAGR